MTTSSIGIWLEDISARRTHSAHKSPGWGSGDNLSGTCLCTIRESTFFVERHEGPTRALAYWLGNLFKSRLPHGHMMEPRSRSTQRPIPDDDFFCHRSAQAKTRRAAGAWHGQTTKREARSSWSAAPKPAEAPWHHEQYQGPARNQGHQLSGWPSEIYAFSTGPLHAFGGYVPSSAESSLAQTRRSMVFGVETTDCHCRAWPFPVESQRQRDRGEILQHENIDVMRHRVESRVTRDTETTCSNKVIAQEASAS